MDGETIVNTVPCRSDLCTFMQQPSALVAAFVRACWLRRCSQEVQVHDVVDALDDFIVCC